ncbi:hypothetical protein ACW0JT_00745 [Arthrobacter sp. SA17]
MNHELRPWIGTEMSRRWLRWMPGVVVPALIAAGVAVGSLPASAVDPLPAKSPAQVLALVAEHKVHSLGDSGADFQPWLA